MRSSRRICPQSECHTFSVAYQLPVACVALLLMAPVISRAQERVVYTPLPLTNAESVIAQSRDILNFIEHELGLSVEIRYEAEYTTIVDKFVRGEIHLVHLGPLPYIVLRALAPYAEPLVAFRESDGQAGYTCSLAAAVDGDIDPAQTQGPVALTQALSTCGFLVTQYLLSSAGQDLRGLPYTFLGSHEAVALALVRGEFAIGGIKTSIGREYERLGLRLLMEGPEQPGFVLVANSRVLDQATRDALVSVLTDAPARVYSDWQGLGRWGMVTTTDSCFNELRCLDGISMMPDCGGLNCAVLQTIQDGLCGPE